MGGPIHGVARPSSGAATARDPAAPSRTDRAERFGVDFLKFFASGLGLGVTLFGYAYLQAFFRGFGISFPQVDTGWLAVLYRGLANGQDPWVLAAAVTVLLVSSGVFALRDIVPPLLEMIPIAVAMLFFVSMAFFGGQRLGFEGARRIWEDGEGAAAFCRLDASASPAIRELDRIVQTQALSPNGGIRLILTSRTYTYLAPVLGPPDDVAEDREGPVRTGGRAFGEAYAVANDHVLYCRVIGD